MWLLAGLALFSLAACASIGGANETNRSPRPQAEHRPAERAAQHAAKMVGKPYRYGGSTPAGFDCSGLVQYSFRQAGMSLPRSTDEQRQVSRRIQKSDLRPGDLLFFDQEGKKNSHVGIYLGRGEFVHAPSSGKQVRRDRMDSAYWRNHLSEVRRVSA